MFKTPLPLSLSPSVQHGGQQQWGHQGHAGVLVLSLAPFALGSRTAGQVIPNYFELLQNTRSYDFGVSASQQYVRYLCLPSVPASSISDCASCMLGLVRNGLNENSN